MNPISIVVWQRLLNIPVLLALMLLLLASEAAEDKYELSNAVIADVVKTIENKNTVQEVILTDDQILEMYRDVNFTITMKSKPKEPPVSVMSGTIPDHLIKKLADYLFSLLQGTGNVIKPATTSIAPPTITPKTSLLTHPSFLKVPPDFLLFRPKNQNLFEDLAVIRDLPKTAESPFYAGQIRRKPTNKINGMSKKKSEKLWRKARMVKLFGRI